MSPVYINLFTLKRQVLLFGIEILYRELNELSGSVNKSEGVEGPWSKGPKGNRKECLLNVQF